MEWLTYSRALSHCLKMFFHLVMVEVGSSNLLATANFNLNYHP